jgi:hypothetical protein
MSRNDAPATHREHVVGGRASARHWLQVLILSVTVSDHQSDGSAAVRRQRTLVLLVWVAAGLSRGRHGQSRAIPRRRSMSRRAQANLARQAAEKKGASEGGPMPRHSGGGERPLAPKTPDGIGALLVGSEISGNPIGRLNSIQIRNKYRGRRHNSNGNLLSRAPSPGNPDGGVAALHRALSPLGVRSWARSAAQEPAHCRLSEGSHARLAGAPEDRAALRLIHRPNTHSGRDTTRSAPSASHVPMERVVELPSLPHPERWNRPTGLGIPGTPLRPERPGAVERALVCLPSPSDRDYRSHPSHPPRPHCLALSRMQ